MTLILVSCLNVKPETLGMEADAMMQVDALIKKCGEINSSSINTHFAIRRNKQPVVSGLGRPCLAGQARRIPR
jgi:hypothetical protein